jgi:serine/threonine-protein kinase
MGLSALLPSVPIVAVVVAIALISLVLAQSQRWIEKTDLIIIAGISLGLELFLVPGLRSPTAIMIPISIALGSIAVTALFRLIYIILDRLLR